MKKFRFKVSILILYILGYLLAPHHTAVAQNSQFSIFNIDTSQFPNIKANFYAFDKGKQLQDLTQSDFKIVENGIPRNILKVMCPDLKPVSQLSLSFSIDTSMSMFFPGNIDDLPIELAKITASTLTNIIALPESEIALLTCNIDISTVRLDFTTNSGNVINAIRQMRAWGDDQAGPKNITDQLLHPENGLLNIAKKGKNKRIAILYTDAIWSPLTDIELQRCIDTCKKYDIEFYSIIYSEINTNSNIITKSLKELAEATGGEVFEGVTTFEASEKVARELEKLLQKAEPCLIQWQSSPACSTWRNSNISIPKYNVENYFNYSAPVNSNIFLNIFQSSIVLGGISPGEFKDTSITIQAINSPLLINEILGNNPSFTIIDYDGTVPPFILEKEEKRSIKIRYLPKDSSQTFVRFEIKNNGCTSEYFYLSAGFKEYISPVEPLRITSPNNGELFVVGNDTVINWAGVSPSDTVELDYSLDHGKNWQNITKKATGLQYSWHVPNTISNTCLIRAKALAPIEYLNGVSKHAIGKNNDFATSIATDNLGNIYVCGSFDSPQIDFGSGITLPKSKSNIGDKEIFLAKYDRFGKIVWARKAWGSNTDEVSTIAIDHTGNIYIGGYFYSGDLDFGDNIILKNTASANPDVFIAKYDSNGKIHWATTVVGSVEYTGAFEYLTSITIDNSGNVYACGFFNTNSYDFGSGIILPSHDGDEYDSFIAKYNNSGKVQWANLIGGYHSDNARSIATDSIGNIYVCGYFDSPKLLFGKGISLSKTTDKSDVFIAKYDNNGGILWAQKAAGSENDEASSIASDNFGNIFIAGYFSSPEVDFGNGVTLLNSKAGNHDSFLAKYDDEGNIIWAKKAGGEGEDRGQTVSSDHIGNIYLGGFFQSSILNLDNGIGLSNGGGSDIFTAKFDSKGNLIGAINGKGSGDDYIQSIASDNNGNIYTCGEFGSPTFDLNGIVTFDNSSTTPNDKDIFLSKTFKNIINEQSDTSNLIFSIVKPEATSTDIDMGRVLVTTLKDSTILNFIRNTGKYPIRIDSIAIAGSNSTDFQILPVSLPLTIPVGNQQEVGFTFRPTAAGIRSANIIVLTQADTLRQKITGDGSTPVIRIEAPVIDFGAIETDSFKDSTITAILTNTGTGTAYFTGTSLSGANQDQFEIISGAGDFVLNTDDTHPIQLRFKPKFIGSISAQITFDYNDINGQPAIVQLMGQGIEPLKSMVFIKNDSAYIGDKTNLSLKLTEGSSVTIAQQKPTRFKARVAYQNSILTPFKNISGATVLKGIGVDTLDITGNWNGASMELASIPARATLGDRTETALELISFNWLNDGGEILTYNTDLQNGVFKILGICQEGGERLYNINGKAQMMSVAPHPANGIMTISFETIERGEMRLVLTDVLGQQTVLKSGDFEKGAHSFEFDTENLASGMYILTMQTPTQFFTQQIIIEK